MITNQQLIDHLSQFPRDAVVIINMFSECVDLDLDDVFCVRAEDKKLFRHKGMYITYHYIHAKPSEGDEFVTAVCFPGN